MAARPARRLAAVAAAMLVLAAAGRALADEAPARPATIAEVLRPEGDGPFPAIVILHGCSGIIQAERGWSQELRKRGYVAVLVDSFRLRGHREICTDFRRVTRTQRVADAYDALVWLRVQPWVRPGAVALMGFSNGGYTLLQAMRGAEPRGFAAAVALYPECSFDVGATFYAPLLILMGEADDWTLASHCRDLTDAASRAGGAPVTLHVYPGAHHGFDNPAVSIYYYATARNGNKPGGCCGATVGYNAQAHADALERVGRFLAEQLTPR
jgi:dienelactone hydrolase